MARSAVGGMVFVRPVGWLRRIRPVPTREDVEQVETDSETMTEGRYRCGR